MSDGCSKSHLEMVRLVRFRTVSDEFLYMTGKRMEFLIDLYGSWTQCSEVIENSTCLRLIFVLFFCTLDSRRISFSHHTACVMGLKHKMKRTTESCSNLAAENEGK